ncbi:WW domain-containing protein tag-325 isoform X1 [Lepeophtheirus salmonis]|uniref:WW domain-containing protein tag-325 isoform X1 n=1 Tax=Lepeophtheirus salmonis TaxID=72036 RepID=UPI001AEA89D1|nr:WW domain-containing protein tag-325-like isoform X1 [Lepeophtheirus salmonis]
MIQRMNFLLLSFPFDVRDILSSRPGSKSFLSVGSGISQEDESNPRNVVHSRGGSRKISRYKSFREKTSPLEPGLDRNTEQSSKSPFSRHRHISQSFNLRGMSVQLRKKKPASPTTANSLSPFGEIKHDAKSFLSRAPSRRRLVLSRFFDKNGRKQKEELEESGILLKEAVFGNDLEYVASIVDPDFRDGEIKLPEFVVRAVKRIENEFIRKEGLYRVNGYDVTVQKIRLDVDQNDYRSFESSNEFSVITSSLKLYIRELPDPLISESKKGDFLEAITNRVHSIPDEDDTSVLDKLKYAVSTLEPGAQILLEYILRHLHFVASFESDNKMGYSNLATVFSPNLIHSSSSIKRRPESLICENELCNYVCERLIMGYKYIFNDHED